MLQRVYIDTSIIGGLFDAEFAEDTSIFFDRLKRNEMRVVYSEITLEELVGAPEAVRNYLELIKPTQKELVELTPEAVYLADTYIRERVVGKTSRVDCLHIAIATVYKVDILVSWNFKHIVNLSRIRGYNSVNLRLGHPILEIRTPKEI